MESMLSLNSDTVARWARDLMRLFPRAPSQTKPEALKTMDVWRPEKGQPATLVRWLHFSGHRLSLVITGGEPMVDRKNMLAFLNQMSGRPSVECIRIDTNLWWNPEQYPGLDLSKLILMCTFHPSQTDEASYFERIKAVLKAGYKIGMVNYVMDDTNIQTFNDRSRRFRDLGVVLHPNPLWGKGGSYAKGDLELMRSVLPDIDFRYRSGQDNPKGKLCNFPVIAYEMDATGLISPGCLYDRSGSFFDAQLPKSPNEAVPCPFESCVCLDKYSFLEGGERNLSLNPLQEYSNNLLAKANDR